jgi:hypothetical protein
MQAAGFWPSRARGLGVQPPRDVTTGDVREAPSTEPQREVWLADKLSPEASLAYNESISLHLRGELDVAAFRAAVRELPKRHDALRSTFAEDGTLLRIGAVPELEVPIVDADAAGLAAIVQRHVSEPFDLEKGPLIRAELVRLEPNHHVLVFTGHHIVIDGWSFWVVVKDLGALYGIATGTRKAQLPEAPSYVVLL